MDMAKLDDFLATIQSPSTRKSYRNGIGKFEEFLGHQKHLSRRFR
jgi:hypothetical protein